MSDVHIEKWGDPELGKSGGTVTYFIEYDSSWWASVIEDAFDQWESYADITFVEAGRRGADIVIGWDYIDGRKNVVGFTEENAHITFDTAEDWSTLDFSAVVLHEIGHAIGLDHTDAYSIMNTGSAAEITEYDIASIQAIYGPANSWFYGDSIDAGSWDYGWYVDGAWSYGWHTESGWDYGWYETSIGWSWGWFTHFGWEYGWCRGPGSWAFGWWYDYGGWSCGWGWNLGWVA